MKTLYKHLTSALVIIAILSISTGLSAQVINLKVGGVSDAGHGQRVGGHVMGNDGYIYIAGHFNDTLHINDTIYFKNGPKGNGFVARLTPNMETEWVHIPENGPFAFWNPSVGNSRQGSLIPAPDGGVYMYHYNISTPYTTTIKHISKEGNVQWSHSPENRGLPPVADIDASGNLHFMMHYSADTLYWDSDYVTYDNTLYDYGLAYVKLTSDGMVEKFENIGASSENAECDASGSTPYLFKLNVTPDDRILLSAWLGDREIVINGHSEKNCTEPGRADENAVLFILDINTLEVSNSFQMEGEGIASFRDIKTDGEGRIYLTGMNRVKASELQGETIPPGAFLLALNNAGDFEWVNTPQDNTKWRGESIALKDNFIHLAGSGNDFSNYGDVFISIFDTDGNELYHYYENRFFPEPAAITIDHEGYPVLSGNSVEAIAMGEHKHIFYGSDFFTARLCDFTMFLTGGIEIDGDQYFLEDEPPTLRVDSDDRINYQWYFNSLPLSENDYPGATSHEFTVEEEGDYFIRMTDKAHSNYCYYETSPVTLVKTGVSISKAKQEKSFDIDVFPNPAGDHVTFLWPSGHTAGNIKITLLQLDGRTVKSTSADAASGKLEMNLSGLSKGMYLYKVTGQAGYESFGKIMTE